MQGHKHGEFSAVGQGEMNNDLNNMSQIVQKMTLLMRVAQTCSAASNLNLRKGESCSKEEELLFCGFHGL